MLKVQGGCNSSGRRAEDPTLKPSPPRVLPGKEEEADCL
jgi:hypothetical protein